VRDKAAVLDGSRPLNFVDFKALSDVREHPTETSNNIIVKMADDKGKLIVKYSF
jgi:hypothetical protein